VPLCGHCDRDIVVRRVLPEFNVGNGKDFGGLDARDGLGSVVVPELNFMEQQVVARCLRFQQCVKFVGSRRNVGGVTTVKGHVVAFGHEGRSALDAPVDVLPRRSLDGLVCIAFVGDAQQWSAMVARGPARDRFLERHYGLKIAVRSMLLRAAALTSRARARAPRFDAD
jgi:hypothetical protein